MARNIITVATDKAVSSCSGSGPTYTVNYSVEVTWQTDDSSPPAIPVQTGDWVEVEKRTAGAGGSSSVLSTYTYQVTGITDKDTLTLKYISDTDSDGDDSPCDLAAGTGSSGSPDKAPHTFYRDLGPAFLTFLEA
jgi:hypothetical protein